MDKSEQNSKRHAKGIIKLMLSILLLVGIILGVVAASGIYMVNAKVKDSLSLMQTIDKENIKQMTNENLSEDTVEKLRDRWTIAVFGLDSRDSDGLSGANSDVIMLISMNGKTREIKLVSVYRDTCLKTGEGKYRKANSAYASGGPKRAVAMLNENLDLKIDDYIAVNWKAVADGINLLGGVDLEITEKEYKYINSFITETVNSTGIPSVHLKRAGENHLDGVQAVAYCRLRLMDDDFMRTKRQQKVISLVMEKAAHADYATLNQLIEVILPQTASSIDAEDLYTVAGNILKLQKPEVLGFPSINYCKTVDGASFVFADSLEKNVTLLHEFLYDSDDFVPSNAVKKISLAIKNKAEGTRRTMTYSEETLESSPIIEETEPEEIVAEETVFQDEINVQTAAPETEPTVEVFEIPETVQTSMESQVTNNQTEPESLSTEESSDFEKEDPGYEKPVPEPDVDEEDGYVYMD